MWRFARLTRYNCSPYRQPRTFNFFQLHFAYYEPPYPILGSDEGRREDFQRKSLKSLGGLADPSLGKGLDHASIPVSA
jgi:hypothetical protein